MSFTLKGSEIRLKRALILIKKTYVHEHEHTQHKQKMHTHKHSEECKTHHESYAVGDKLHCVQCCHTERTFTHTHSEGNGLGHIGCHIHSLTLNHDKSVNAYPTLNQVKLREGVRQPARPGDRLIV